MMSYIPPKAGTGYILFDNLMPTTIVPFEGDWYDAAMIYKEWVEPNAEWLKQGKMINRTDIPEWAFNITTWVNSHWQ